MSFWGLEGTKNCFPLPISHKISVMNGPKIALRLLIPLLCMITAHTSWARELSDVTIPVSTVKKGTEAKQEAFDKATEEATLKLTEELLGAERTAKYWPNLRAKLLRNSSRYVVFIKGSAPVETQGFTQINVVMRLSPDSLETILREEGLMGSGTVRILPLVQVVQANGVAYNWWADKGEDEKSGAGAGSELFKSFFKQLAAKFKAKNAYVLDPTNQSFRLSVPSTYRTEALRREDQAVLAQYLKADVVITGRVAVTRPTQEGARATLSLDLQIWQAKSGREIGTVVKADPLASVNAKTVIASVEQSGAAAFEELSARLGEVLASGNLNLNIVKVQILGNLDYRQQTEFRKALTTQVREIKSLRERLFEPSRVTYEAETSVSSQELAKSLSKANFSSFQVQIEETQDNSLALQVKPLASSLSR